MHEFRSYFGRGRDVSKFEELPELPSTNYF